MPCRSAIALLLANVLPLYISYAQQAPCPGCRKPRRSDQELFDQMTELYPHWVANQSWLMFGFPQP